MTSTFYNPVAQQYQTVIVNPAKLEENKTALARKWSRTSSAAKAHIICCTIFVMTILIGTVCLIEECWKVDKCDSYCSYPVQINTAIAFVISLICIIGFCLKK